MSRLINVFMAILRVPSLLLFCVVLVLTSCTTRGLQPTVNHTPGTTSRPPTAILETTSPATAAIASIPSATATTIAMTASPGWAWYEEPEAPGILFQLPQAWRVRPSRPQRFQSPETRSILEVRAFDYVGSDWLDWVQHESQPGYSLADGFVKENGLVRGRPAFHFVEVGGEYTMELYVRDEGRIVLFFFQSATMPRSEEEMDTLWTLFETVQFARGNEGETSLPTGWLQGLTLTTFYPEQLNFSGELQTITGTVETWQMGPPPNEATVVDASGARYQIDLQAHYSFEGFPIAYLADLPVRFEVAPGRSITVKGYHSGETPNGTPRIYPLVVEAYGEEEQAILFYQPFVDLYSVSAEKLAEYPDSATVYVRGPWSQVGPLFGSEPQESAPDSMEGVDSSVEVLAKGTLARIEPPHLNVSELYYLDGVCAMVRSDVQQCQYFQQVK